MFSPLISFSNVDRYSIKSVYFIVSQCSGKGTLAHERKIEKLRKSKFDHLIIAFLNKIVFKNCYIIRRNLKGDKNKKRCFGN